LISVNTGDAQRKEFMMSVKQVLKVRVVSDATSTERPIPTWTTPNVIRKDFRRGETMWEATIRAQDAR
jgi:hypothetical protein